MDPVPVTRPCELCGGRGGTVALVGRDRRHGVEGVYRVMRCRGCGLARTDPVPEDLGAVYPDAEYMNYQERGDLPARVFAAVMRRTATGSWPRPLRAVATWAVPAAALGGPLRPGQRVLDVGAGSGHAVAAMRAAGLDAHGIEPNANAVSVARAAGAHTVRHGTFEAAELERGEWDLIRFWHALEHVVEPVVALRRAHDALRPGGRVVVGVPNFGGAGRRLFGPDWDGLELPRHLTHFTARTLRGALAAAGFRQTRLTSVAIMGVLCGSLDARTRRDDRQRAGASSTALQLALHPVELALAGMGLGDGLLAVARR
jgi:2-polyprenyl-3-methyl-5-hydroxy-6-metoxy-1,4-benzoquinol methylase